MAQIKYKYGLAYNGTSHDDNIVWDDQYILGIGIDTKSTGDIRLSRNFSGSVQLGTVSALQDIAATSAIYYNFSNRLFTATGNKHFFYGASDVWTSDKVVNHITNYTVNGVQYLFIFQNDASNDKVRLSRISLADAVSASDYTAAGSFTETYLEFPYVEESGVFGNETVTLQYSGTLFVAAVNKLYTVDNLWVKTEIFSMSDSGMIVGLTQYGGLIKIYTATWKQFFINASDYWINTTIEWGDRINFIQSDGSQDYVMTDAGLFLTSGYERQLIAKKRSVQDLWGTAYPFAFSFRSNDRTNASIIHYWDYYLIDTDNNFGDDPDVVVRYGENFLWGNNVFEYQLAYDDQGKRIDKIYGMTQSGVMMYVLYEDEDDNIRYWYVQNNLVDHNDYPKDWFIVFKDFDAWDASSLKALRNIQFYGSNLGNNQWDIRIYYKDVAQDWGDTVTWVKIYDTSEDGDVQRDTVRHNVNVDFHTLSLKIEIDSRSGYSETPFIRNLQIKYDLIKE